MRLSLAVAVAATLGGVLAPAAFAHAEVTSSVPGYAEFVAKAPEQIVLTFDEPVRPIAGNAVVEGSSLSVLSGPPRTAPGRPNVLLLPLRAGLTDGYYTARWRVLSDDGHKVQGLLPFAIGKEHGPLRPSLPLLSTSTGPWDLAGRWLFLVGVIGALGAFAFAALVWRPALAALAFESEQVHALRAAELRRRSALLFGCFLLSQFGSALAIQYATTGTRYGRIHELAILIAGAGAASAAFQSRTAQLLAGGAAVALAATPSLSGHALDSGRSQPLTLIADLVHVGSAAIWLGGLFLLLLVARVTTRLLADHDRRALLVEVVRRFSVLAAVCVILVSTSGVVRGTAELRSVEDLWSSSYGHTLLVKSALLLLLVALGWRNRYRLRPRLEVGDDSARSRLQLALLAELCLAAGLVLGVAVLTNQFPPTRASSALDVRSGSARGILRNPLPAIFRMERHGRESTCALARPSSRPGVARCRRPGAGPASRPDDAGRRLLADLDGIHGDHGSRHEDIQGLSRWSLSGRF